VIGGAPYNIAHRASKLGLNATVITSLGKDSLGEELLRLVSESGVDTRYIQLHSTLPTGVVDVAVGEGGEPDYTIVRPVAWDDIKIRKAEVELVKGARAFIYSSLGLRDERSCDALFSVLPHAHLKICDINLREGHYRKETILKMLRHADILRTNEFELATICQWLGLDHLDRRSQMKQLADHYSYKLVLSSLGGEGAVCLQGEDFYVQPVYKVDVVDTVGAGDAFLASFVNCYLGGRDIPACLRMGCILGALTAAKKGGTPQITSQEIDDMLSLHMT